MAAIDMKRVERWTEENPKWVVYTHGGIKRTDINALEWAKDTESLGAGELLVTSMDRDGTKSGFDCKLLSVIHQCTNIPLIASGGAGTISHCIDAIKKRKSGCSFSRKYFSL